MVKTGKISLSTQGHTDIINITSYWQQIICVDFDNRPRKRNIIVQIFGEKE